MPSVKRADEAEQNFQSGDDDPELLQLLHHVVEKDGAFVVGIEVVLLGQRAPHLLLDQLVIVAFVGHPDAVKVVRVLEVAHGTEGNVDGLVDAVVAFLHVRREHADHLVADASNTDVLADGILAGEQLELGVGADDGDAGARGFIVFVQQAALA